MLDPASALVSASAELLERLAGGQRPLSTVSASLADLAAALGVERVIVAIDDAVYGRQVFSSARAPLGEATDLLWGPPRARTEPSRTLDATLHRLIVATVAAAFERARSSPPTVARPGDLVAEVGLAADRSARYGWGFTLVILRFDRHDEHAAREIAKHLRASDTLAELGPREYGIVMPATGGDEVPRILARVGRGGAVSTFCYGLAACPGDATDASVLLALATSRLHDTAEVHTSETPKV